MRNRLLAAITMLVIATPALAEPGDPMFTEAATPLINDDISTADRIEQTPTQLERYLVADVEIECTKIATDTEGTGALDEARLSPDFDIDEARLSPDFDIDEAKILSQFVLGRADAADNLQSDSTDCLDFGSTQQKALDFVLVESPGFVFGEPVHPGLGQGLVIVDPSPRDDHASLL